MDYFGRVAPTQPGKDETRIIAAVARLDFEDVARQVFDRFLVLQPEIPVEGLFRVGGDFFIVAPALDRIVDGGRTLKEWFDLKLHPAATPIFLTGVRPAAAEEVAPRTAKEVFLSRGMARTWHDLDRDLCVVLPKGIPFTSVTEDDRTAVIRVARALTANEARIVEVSFESLGPVVPMRIEIDEARGSDGTPGDLRLVELRPARRLASTTPSSVREAVEADEDMWRRAATFSSAAEAAERLGDSPVWEDVRGRGCLVSTVFRPANIRSYLSLYSAVLIVAPQQTALEGTIEALGVKREQLVTLARRGVVRFLFPQSMDRYDPAWVAELIEAAPGSVVLSRRLAALSIRDQHRRNPLFVLPCDAFERRAALRALHRCASSLPAHASLLVGALARALSEYWEAAEYLLHVRGAMGSLTGPLARFGAAVVEAITNEDVFLEVSAAAQDVEWAGALGVHLVPEHGDHYSSEKAAGLVVALSSGVPRGSGQSIAAPRQFDLANELLAFDNDTDIFDFIDELGAGDLARFRDLVPSIARASRPDEEIRELVEAWNAQVKRYDRRPERLRSWGLAGLALASASALSGSTMMRSVVPWISPLIPFITTRLAEEGARDSRLAGALLDWVNGALGGVRPEAVLLSRMRKRVAGM